MNNLQAKRNYRSKKAALTTRNVIVYIFLIVISIIWLFPFLYLLIQSFSSQFVASSLIPTFPGTERAAQGYPVWTFDQYIRLFTDDVYPFWKWYLNTFIIALVSSILQTVLVLGTSYAFSRLRFKLRKPLMKLILILGMFPGFLSMVIVYFILRLLGLNTSIFSLILIYIAGSAGNYYVSKGFFDTIPRSLDEAAMIDGANKNTIFFRIILPLAKPIIVYTLLMSFTGPWGDYMFPAMLAGGNIQNKTVATGLYTLINTLNTRVKYFPMFCAGGVFVSIPIMILFFCLQKYYVEGITGGAVKG